MKEKILVLYTKDTNITIYTPSSLRRSPTLVDLVYILFLYLRINRNPLTNNLLDKGINTLLQESNKSEICHSL